MTSDDLNQGKVVFVSKEEADRAARRMSQKHGEAFSSYKITSGWAVGGVFLKKPKKLKVKSLNEIKDILSGMGLSLGMKLDGFVAPTSPAKAADSDVDENRIMSDRGKAEDDEALEDIED